MAQTVTIRPYEPVDAPELYAAVHESMAEVAPWMPWCHPGYSRNEAADWIEQTIVGHRAGTLFDFAILADGRFAGACGINRIDGANRVANLGYWIRTSRAGAGITPRAVRLLLDWAFHATALNRIEIVAAVDNVRSQRVAAKVGARREAVLAERTVVRGEPVDAIMYRVLRSDAR
jgi:RimJ/RimL family protein N-acetyltransferase